MVLGRKCQRINSCDQAVIEGNSLDFIRNCFGSERGESVEGNVHRVNVEFIFMVKVVANLLNLILVNIQPSQGPWYQDVVIRMLCLMRDYKRKRKIIQIKSHKI